MFELSKFGENSVFKPQKTADHPWPMLNSEPFGDKIMTRLVKTWHSRIKMKASVLCQRRDSSQLLLKS